MKNSNLPMVNRTETLLAHISQLPTELAERWAALVLKDGIDRFDLQTAISTQGDHSNITAPRYAMNLDFTAIALRRTPSLIAIKRYGDIDTALDLLAALITGAVRFFNVAGNMSDAQIEETACMVFDTHRILTLDDCALCIKRAKAGAYGKVFDRLDGAVVLGWFEQYISERNDQIEIASNKQHYADKERYNNTKWDKEAIEKLRQMLEAAQARAEAAREAQKLQEQQNHVEAMQQVREEAKKQAERFVKKEKAYWRKVYADYIAANPNTNPTAPTE